jgi:hypothetical protein
MTRDIWSYPWTQRRNYDLCHCYADCQRTVRPKTARDPFVRRCYSMPPCGIAMPTFAIILQYMCIHMHPDSPYYSPSVSRPPIGICPRDALVQSLQTG